MTINSYFSILIFLLISISGSAQIRLPQLISDGIVLQREMPVKFGDGLHPAERSYETVGLSIKYNRR